MARRYHEIKGLADCRQRAKRVLLYKVSKG